MYKQFLLSKQIGKNHFSIIFAKKQINSKRQSFELIQNLFYPKKNRKNTREKNSQRVKLSIPQTTHRKPIVLTGVFSGYKAIIVVQVAVPSAIGIAL